MLPPSPRHLYLAFLPMLSPHNLPTPLCSHWYMCLFLYGYHAVLIIAALLYSLKLGSIISPALFLFYIYTYTHTYTHTHTHTYIHIYIHICLLYFRFWGTCADHARLLHRYIHGNVVCCLHPPSPTFDISPQAIPPQLPPTLSLPSSPQ